MNIRPQRHVHLRVRQSEVKFVLALRKTVRIRGWNGVANLGRQLHVARQRVYLGFVEMRDGFDVGRAVLVLEHEIVD